MRKFAVVTLSVLTSLGALPAKSQETNIGNQPITVNLQASRQRQEEMRRRIAAGFRYLSVEEIQQTLSRGEVNLDVTDFNRQVREQNSELRTGYEGGDFDFAEGVHYRTKHSAKINLANRTVEIISRPRLSSEDVESLLAGEDSSPMTDALRRGDLLDKHTYSNCSAFSMSRVFSMSRIETNFVVGALHLLCDYRNTNLIVNTNQEVDGIDRGLGKVVIVISAKQESRNAQPVFSIDYPVEGSLDPEEFDLNKAKNEREREIIRSSLAQLQRLTQELGGADQISALPEHFEDLSISVSGPIRD